MADVFVSYAHVDDADVRKIVDALTKLGFAVWWDISLRSGDRYGDVIENELSGAKCVLVVWSRNSRNSNWVKAEASLGNDAEKLVQVTLQPDVKPPLPFNIVHFEPVPDGPRGEDWEQLVEAIRTRVGGAASARAPARAPAPIDLATICSVLAALCFAAYLLVLNVPALAQTLRILPPWLGDGANLIVYVAAAFGFAAALLSVQRIAATARAEGSA